MTEQLSQTRLQLILGFVPEAWLEVSYPTLKPLASYIRDLNMRILTLDKWVTEGKPPEVFWLSGFFFTQSFLTAILQNYARKYHIEIDALQFEFKFTNKADPTDHEKEVYSRAKAIEKGLDIEVPEDGALVSGLFFEGCRWDYEN
jgi:dynein heavy chain